MQLGDREAAGDPRSEAANSRLFERCVSSLHLSVRPWVIRFDQAMFDAKAQRTQLNGWSPILQLIHRGFWEDRRLNAHVGAARLNVGEGFTKAMTALIFHPAAPTKFLISPSVRAMVNPDMTITFMNADCWTASGTLMQSRSPGAGAAWSKRVTSCTGTRPCWDCLYVVALPWRT